MLGTLRAVKFLFLAPFILVMLLVINWMTFSGEWWIKWAALGMGIAWFVSLFRVLKAAVILGGLSALATYLTQRRAKTP